MVCHTPASRPFLSLTLIFYSVYGFLCLYRVAINMEALVALSFAANVVQFADFTSRVISQSIKIYRTRNRSDVDDDSSTTYLGKLHTELISYTSFVGIDNETRALLGEESLVTKLRKRNLSEESAPEGIDRTFAVRKAVQISACDRKIFELCMRCEDVALDIREAIVKLESKSLSRPTMWRSFAEALRTIWDENKFETLANQLKSYRETMMALLLASLRYVPDMLRHLYEAEK
jgi:hypothetical protein